MIKKWQNNRKLTDPKEFNRVRDWYIEPRAIMELTSSEDIEDYLQRLAAKERNITNNAR